MSARARLETGLAWALRPFVKVAPSEAITAVAMTLTVFLLLTAYYLLKTAREPLILLHGGAEVKSYASAGQALILVGVVQAYGALAKRVGRMTLLAIVYGFFIANIVVFAILVRAGAPIGVVFFLWVGVFNMTAVAQFWSLAADIYNNEQGKRLLAVIGIGSSTGAMAGSWLAAQMVSLGPEGLMFASAGILAACVGLFAWIDRRERASAGAAQATKHEAPVLGDHVFRTLVHDRYLLLIGALALVLNCVNKNGEYIVDRTLLDAAAIAKANGADATAFVSAFKADYFGWYNLVGLLLQLFAVSRIMKVLGVRIALLFLPAVALLGYTALAIVPTLAVARVVKIAENGLDYSLESTTQNALYLVTSRAGKYIGKIFIDGVVVRLGDVFSALIVWAGTLAGMPLSGFAAVNVGLAVVWIFVVVLIGKKHARQSVEAAGEASVEPVPA